MLVRNRGPVQWATIALTAAVLWLVQPVLPARVAQDAARAGQAAPAGGRLLYTRDGALWSLRLGEGQEPVQVMARPRIGLILGARWAPDGSRFAYTQYEVVPERNAPMSSLSIAAADGSGSRQMLTADDPGTQLVLPTWSADSRFLYYLRRAPTLGAAQRIERLDIGSGERTAVSELVGEFDVSLDGRWLAVANAPGGKPALTLVDLRSGETTPVIPPGVFDMIDMPRFDPTSQTIVFSGLRWADAGAGPVRLGAGVSFLEPLRAAVARAHGLPADLYTVPVGGGPTRRLTKLMLDDPVGAWAPDGTQLALMSSEFLAITPAAEGTPSPLLSPGGYGSVDWAR